MASRPDTRTRFSRFEYKLVLDAPEAQAVTEWADRHLLRDTFGDGAGRYLINTLYLDSPAFDIYHRISEGGAKYRIRRYGEDEVVWLERKVRRGALVKKRREAWPAAELDRLLRGAGSPSGWPGAFQEAVISRSLRPVLLVIYPRTAWNGQGSVRATLDHGVTVHRIPPREPALWKPATSPIVVTDRTVLELKFDELMPPIFEGLLRTLGRDPGAFSKYGQGLEKTGIVLTGDEDGPD